MEPSGFLISDVARRKAMLRRDLPASERRVILVSDP